VPEDDSGSFVLENSFHAKGGPPRHRHLAQDEWFYCIDGVFLFEIGKERFTLGPGESILGPRGVPHVWSSIGEKGGRILIAFFPAGRMMQFFLETAKANAMPPQTPDLWIAHGMELMGPPLEIPGA